MLRAVGRGGMGTVWLCRDELLGREVAVKQVGVLPGESVPDLARALREARSSAALHHPHVVSVFDVVEADDHIWLVMEYVPGETLSQLIAREGRLDPERVAAVGAQIADGLVAAHARGTVHRDVKPGNVLIAGDTAKISDFGIARTHGGEQLTRSGLVMGTPLYFSPELARGAEPSPAADVWALGATLYAAVEGVAPIADRGNAIATLTAIAETRPPHPEHAAFLTNAIGRMLDPDPSSRWTMEDAAQALRRLHEQHRSPGTLATTVPVESASPSAPVAPGTADVGTPPARDHRSRWPVLVGALILLLVSGMAGAVLLDRAGHDPSGSSSGTTALVARSVCPAEHDDEHPGHAVSHAVLVHPIVRPVVDSVVQPVLRDREPADVCRGHGADRGRLLRAAAHRYPERLGDARPRRPGTGRGVWPLRRVLENHRRPERGRRLGGWWRRYCSGRLHHRPRSGAGDPAAPSRADR